jgi:ribose 5-phosphate isomerase B
MKIAIASDHAGFEYKEKIKQFLIGAGHEVTDFGTNSAASCDYPDFIHPAAQAVADGKCERGIVLGGSGNGEAIAANKVKGVRCGLAWDLRSARLCRQHNDANVLSLGQRMMAIEEALEIVELWLATDYEGGRHQKRIDKIELDCDKSGCICK